MSEIHDFFGTGEPAAEAPLTSQGVARREAMLLELKRVVDRRRLRRRRAKLAALAALVTVPLAVYLLKPPPERSGDVAAPTPGAAPAAPPSLRLEHARLEVVRSAPGVIERYLVRPAPPGPEVFLDDEGLLALLAKAGRPAGLVRSGGRVFLTGEAADLLPR